MFVEQVFHYSRLESRNFRWVRQELKVDKEKNKAKNSMQIYHQK